MPCPRRHILRLFAWEIAKLAFLFAANLQIVSEHMNMGWEQKRMTKKVVYVTRSGNSYGTFSIRIDGTRGKHATSLQRKAVLPMLMKASE